MRNPKVSHPQDGTPANGAVVNTARSEQELTREQEAISPARVIQPRSSRGTVIIVLAAVSILFTLCVLQFSFRHNRLAFHLIQDDITYISDGLDRLAILYGSGITGLVHSHISYPPYRSPVGTYMATLGFAIFGTRDWAPYATNSVFIFIMLWAIYVVMADRKKWQIACAMAFALGSLLAVMTVNEFRPDLACGLFTALGMVALIRRPFVDSTFGHKLAVGALFGGALVIKPSIFPATIGFFGLAVLGAIVRDLFTARDRSKWAAAVRGIVWSGVAMVVVSLPYFAFGWRSQYEYLAVNLVNPEIRKIWTIPGGLDEQLRYYLTGPGGQFLLGRHLALFGIIMVAGTAFILWTRSRSAILNVIYAAFLLAVTFFTPALTPGKNTFGGASFSWLVLFSCVLLLRAAIDQNAVRWPRYPWAAVCLGLAALISVYFFRFPAVWSTPGTAEARIGNRFVVDVFDAVLAKLDEAPLGKTRLFTTTYGIINYQLLKYLAVREDRSPREIPILLPPDKTDLAPFAEQLKKADLVLASESNNGVTAPMMPSSAVQDQTLAMALQSPDFVELRRFPTANGKLFFLLERKGAFYGWHKVEGLGKLDGPFPNANLPVLRCGYGPSTKLYFTSPADQILNIQLRAKSYVPVQTMTVDLDGERLATYEFQDASQFVDLVFSGNARRGEHVVEIGYTDWTRVEPVPGAVLFERLQLETSKAAAAAASGGAPRLQRLEKVIIGAPKLPSAVNSGRQKAVATGGR